jgi:hypothetical protein
MPTTNLRYIAGATLPNATLTCQDDAGTSVDLSSGYTFTLRVGTATALSFSKTAGITGTSTGVTVDWAASGEIGALTVGTYLLTLYAASSGESRAFTATLTIDPAVPAA